MAVKNISVSTLAKIKNQSLQEGISNQLGLQLFFQEEFLRKLSKSNYRDNMILKGGMFVYTLTEFDSRPTRDMDFMIRRLSAELDNIQTIMNEICRIETDTLNRIERFKDSPSMLTMWNSYEPASISGLPFVQAINRLIVFIGPIYEALSIGKTFSGKWDSKSKKWNM